MSRRPQRVSLFAAVLLAVAIAGSVWWYGARRAASVRLPRASREVAVRALWYSPDERGPSWGTSRVLVRIEPNDVPGARVGFYEDEAHGSGEMWRASAWMAAVVASLEAGVDLEQYTPSFWVEGRIDGASGGALLAVAVLAGLTEHELPAEATITGTVNPDGTIGRVGGLAYKIQAAVEAGMRRVLIPRGQSQERDAGSGGMVDVVALGKAKGVEVVEVGDVAEAYARMTGRRLPRLAGDEVSVALPPVVADELASRARTWLATYRKESAAYERVEKRGLPAMDLRREKAAAQQAAARAEQRLAEGRVAEGYDEAVRAALQMAAGVDLLKAARALDVDGMRGALRAVTPRKDRASEIAITASKICTLAAPTVDGLLATADALGTIAQAAGLLKARSGLVSALESNPDDPGAVEALFRAAALQGLDRHLLAIAEDRAMLVCSRKGRSVSAPRRLAAWSTTMERAASANLGYFEAVGIAETARSLGLHPDVLQTSAEYGEPTYLMAQASLAALPELQGALGQVERCQAAALGTSVGAYAGGSALVTKYCSLGVKTDSSGQVVGISDAEALDRLLKSARARALGDIAAARGVGLEGSVPIFYYLAASEHASGNSDEKLEALQGYWQASLYARIGRLLVE